MNNPDFSISEITEELGAVRHSILNPNHEVVVQTLTAESARPASVQAECDGCEWWNQVLI